MDKYNLLFNSYSELYKKSLCMKCHTVDSTFFLIRNVDDTFNVVKFYNDGIDFRQASFDSLAEAYTMAVVAL